MNKLFIPLIFALFLITGCDNNDFMQSESSVNGKLKGSWKRHKSSSDPKQIWKMENGNLTVYSTALEGKDSIMDHGSYSVLTKFSKVYMTISGITNAALEPQNLNTRWNITELSGAILYLSSTDSRGTVIWREFIKQ